MDALIAQLFHFRVWGNVGTIDTALVFTRIVLRHRFTSISGDFLGSFVRKYDRNENSFFGLTYLYCGGPGGG